MIKPEYKVFKTDETTKNLLLQVRSLPETVSVQIGDLVMEDEDAMVAVLTLVVLMYTQHAEADSMSFLRKLKLSVYQTEQMLKQQPDA